MAPFHAHRATMKLLLCILAFTCRANAARGFSLPGVVRLRGGADSEVDRSKWETYTFPDGSAYRGETKDGRLCGQGEWRSAQGENYAGSFVDDVFHGPGAYTDAAGNVLRGTFERGSMNGPGTFIHSDGRADVVSYVDGKEHGIGVRCSPDRTQAWKLKDGEPVGSGETFDVEKDQIPLEEAAGIAAELGLSLPPSIFAVPEEATALMVQRIRSQLQPSDESAQDEATRLATAPLDARLRGTNLDGREGFLVAHSASPLVPRKVCEGIIEECEERAARLGGWSTRRHTNYPTTDVSIAHLPRTLSWVRNVLLPDIAWPLLARSFGWAMPAPSEQHCADVDSAEKSAEVEREVSAAAALRISDAFVVKYNASAGQRELLAHRDGAVFSFNVALNPLDDYEGGGTEFNALAGAAIRSPQGHIAVRYQMAHSSALMHGGHPVVSGVRYILVCFVSVDAEHAEWAKTFCEHVAACDVAPSDGHSHSHDHSHGHSHDT